MAPPISDYFGQKVAENDKNSKFKISGHTGNFAEENDDMSKLHPLPTVIRSGTVDKKTSKSKILCWNEFGMVKISASCQLEETSTPTDSEGGGDVTIIMGKSSSPLHINLLPRKNWTMASLCSHGVVLATNDDCGMGGHLVCTIFKGHTKKQLSWNARFPAGEMIKSVSITERFVIVITGGTILNLYTIGGIYVDRWCLGGLPLQCAVFGRDIFGVACSSNNNDRNEKGCIVIFLYKLGSTCAPISKSTLQLPEDCYMASFIFTKEGVPVVVSGGRMRLSFGHSFLSDTWNLLGMIPLADSCEELVVISAYTLHQKLSIRYYVPSVIQNASLLTLIDFKEAAFESVDTENKFSYLSVIQDEIVTEDSKSKPLRLYSDIELPSASLEKEDILLDLFLHLVRKKNAFLAMNVFWLFTHERHIQSALGAASVSGQKRLILLLDEIAKDHHTHRGFTRSSLIKCQSTPEGEEKNEFPPSPQDTCTQIDIKSAVKDIKVATLKEIEMPTQVQKERNQTPATSKDILKNILSRTSTRRL